MIYLLLLLCITFSIHASQMSQSEATKIEQQSQAREKRRAARACRKKTIDEHLNLKMFTAILQDNTVLLRDLLSAQSIPNVNAIDDTVGTPLGLAAGRNNCEAALLLLEHGADPNKRDSRDSTPLQRAASRNNTQMFQLLLSHGAQATQKVLDEALIAAAFGQALEMVKILVDLGANINTQLPVESDQRARSTPLIAALYMPEDLDVTNAIANYLISHGANVHLKDKNKGSALHYAARALNARMINQLIDHGAQVDDKDISGFTPLMVAATELQVSQDYKTIAQAEETIETLIALGADYFLTNEKYKNKTVFDYASNYSSIIKRAIEAGRGIRMRNLKATEAQLEEEEYIPGIAQMITEYSGARSQKRKRAPEQSESKENIADEGQPGKRQRTIGLTLLNDIQEAGISAEDLDMQLEANPDLLKVQDSEGLTLLMVAILRNRKSLFDVLLQHAKKQPNPQEYIAMKNAQGQTALDVAQGRNTGAHYAKELLKVGARERA